MASWKNRSIASSARFMPIRMDRKSSSLPTPRTPTWRSASARRADRRSGTTANCGSRSLAEYRQQIREVIRQADRRYRADVGQHERSVVPQRTAVRRLACHAGRAGQRRDRRPHSPRRQELSRSGPAFPLGGARPHAMRPSRLPARGAHAAASIWGCIRSRSTTAANSITKR